MRTPTGEYRIDFFNKYGERLQGNEIHAFALKDAHACAESRLGHTDMVQCSYTVMRCIFNSLDDN